MNENIPELNLLQAGYEKSEAGVYLPKGASERQERPNRLMRRQIEKRARRYKKYQADLAQKRK